MSLGGPVLMYRSPG